jgi:hypothetical protein
MDLGVVSGITHQRLRLSLDYMHPRHPSSREHSRSILGRFIHCVIPSHSRHAEKVDGSVMTGENLQGRDYKG